MAQSLGDLGELLIKVGYQTKGDSLKNVLNGANSVKTGITKSVNSADKEVTRAIKGATSSLKQLKSTITGVLGVLGVGLSVKALNDTAEAYQKVNDSITKATRGRIDQQEAEQKIMEAAKKTRKSYSEMASIVNSNIKAGVSIDTAINRSLRSMIKYQEGTYTISSAIQVIKDEWGLFVADLWKSAEIGNVIGGALVDTFETALDILKKLTPFIMRIIKTFLSVITTINSRIQKFNDVVAGSEDKLNLVNSVLETIGIALGIIAGFKILAFLRTAIAMLNPVLVLLALIVLFIQDVSVFLRGGDSVFGRTLESLGIDAQEAKDYIKDLFDRLKEVGELFKGEGAEGIKRFLKAIFESGGKIIEKLPEMFDAVFGFLESLATLAPETGQLLGDLAKNILPILVQAVTDLFNIGKKIVDEVIKPIVEEINNSGLMDNLGELGGSILEAVKSALDLILPIVGELCEKLVRIVNELLPSLNNLLGGLPELLEAISPLLSAIAQILGVIVDAVGFIINYGVAWVADTVALLKGDTSLSNTGRVLDGAFSKINDSISNRTNPILSSESIPKIVETNSAQAKKKEIQTAFGMGSKNSPYIPSTSSVGGNKTTNVNQSVSITNEFNGVGTDVQGAVANATEKNARTSSEYLGSAIANGR